MSAPPSHNVRSTLLESLFTRPHPVHKREFEKARSHLFPGRDPFVNFLRTDNYQEMTEHAKSAVLRLVYHHHLPPPSRLLFNLLDFEERDSVPVTEGDYIPQDHFVHLVHLYLLGVYFFSYHRTMHHECMTEFNRLRRTWFKRVIGEHPIPVANSYQLFATSWAMFVLYHDLGYPLERIPPDERASRQSWLQPFQKIGKSVIKDLSLKALSNLVALSSFLRENSGISLGDMYFEGHDHFYIHNESSKRSIEQDAEVESSPRIDDDHAVCRKAIKEWSNAVFVRGVGGMSTLQMIGTFLPDAAIGAVLENSESGEPLVFIQKKPEDYRSRVIWFIDPRRAPASVRRARGRLWQLAFQEGRGPREEYAWKYFALNARKYFEDNLKFLLGGDSEGFIQIAARLEEDVEFRTAKLIQSDSARELAYTAYRLMNRSLGYISEDENYSDLDLLFSTYDREFSSMGRSFPKIIALCVEELVHSYIERGELDPGEILRSKGRSDAIAQLVDFMLARGEELEDRLEKVISPEIKKSAEREQYVRECARSVRGQLLERLRTAGSMRGPFSDGPGFRLELTEWLNSLGLTDNLAALVQSLNLGSLDNLLGYKPSWVARNDRFEHGDFVDHGVASALVLLTAANIYSECLSRVGETASPDAPPDIKLLRLSLATTTPAEEEWLGTELKFLSSVVALAILLHNLYPASFAESSRMYRTRLTEQPFAFLALLADGLQKWDRRKLANPAERDVSGIVPGSRFNLRIQGDLIYISLRSNKLDIPAEDQRLRSGLREYLAGADNLIRLQLYEG